MRESETVELLKKECALVIERKDGSINMYACKITGSLCV